MGTRGSYGFKYNGKYKLTYNHFDSYPSGLGLQLKSELKNFSIYQMRNAFDKIIMINDDTEKCLDNILDVLIENHYINYDKSDKEKKALDWYTVLRSWQGSIIPYITYDPVYMINAEQYDPISLEYKYIIDLDDCIFETIDCHDNLSSKISLDILNDMDDEIYLNVINK